MSTRTRLAVVATAIIMLLLLGAVPAFANKAKDRNRNNIPDKWETKYHMSLKKNQAKGDFDKDGLRNVDEFRGKTNPRKADTDSDGTKDGQEDPDSDRLLNVQERACKTHPLKADSDKDGVSDGDEDADCDGLGNYDEFVQGCNPWDDDSDNDGTDDSQEIAGFVTSFDAESGILSIVALCDSERTYEVEVDEATELMWADVVDLDTPPTLEDLKAGAIVNEVNGEMRADGTVLATEIKLMPAPATDTAIATISWYWDGVLGLIPTGGGADYEVIVDEDTEFEWASGVYADHEACEDDLVECASVTDLDITYTADGDLLAKKIVLIPAVYATSD
jgi:hypothetical protein